MLFFGTKSAVANAALLGRLCKKGFFSYQKKKKKIFVCVLDWKQVPAF